ncbi:uncharacterized protein LOC112268863 [Brachypodium distachyon]|uniref:F-box domain-containing protein n=1 Tax=Brachypodium distachyon TaxID=15368 RepID=A0A0Q3EF90_BRADI|nr:uncharacterized protein LOC112268863 [Brachypodium distachyon]KQJ86335.1 hypothetical protein BRADI_4g04770v3 [Brachypodium distachyon]|eukprot:XP_024310820.1 uncharacterized protein LOC112268863 [Brachypodium distachyon]
MAKMNSPLHRVIDARRWDGELLLGRLFILFHAAFVDAGFLPSAAAATASTLSLRYLVPLPQLLAAVALRVCAYGRHVVFYVDTSSVVSGAGSSDYLWACVDAVAAAPLLSGGLDGTARALRNDAVVSALWRELPERLSRRVLREICGGGALLGGTTFMSLPEEMKLSILARLGDGEDLARVSATCSDLRRLVRGRDREFWKRIYDYNAAAPAPSPWWSWLRSWAQMDLIDLWPMCDLFVHPPEPSATEYLACLRRAKKRRRARATAASGVPMEAIPEKMKWSSGGGREKRRHHAGAINSPSARYPWKHR